MPPHLCVDTVNRLYIEPSVFLISIKVDTPCPKDVINDCFRLKLLWLTLTQVHSSCEIEFLPVYTPNDEEKHDPKLYANNVRHLMAKCVQFYVCAYIEYISKCYHCDIFWFNVLSLCMLQNSWDSRFWLHVRWLSLNDKGQENEFTVCIWTCWSTKVETKVRVSICPVVTISTTCFHIQTQFMFHTFDSHTKWWLFPCVVLNNCSYFWKPNIFSNIQTEFLNTIWKYLRF